MICTEIAAFGPYQGPRILNVVVGRHILAGLSTHSSLLCM